MREGKRGNWNKRQWDPQERRKEGGRLKAERGGMI